MTTTNPHEPELRTAQMAYNDHTREMHAKYGHLHADDRLTVEEAMVRMVVSKELKRQCGLYCDYRDKQL